MSATGLSVDGARLDARLDELGSIGSYQDEATGLMGVNRLALTAADGEGRRRVRAWMEELGLEVRVDRIGNIYGRRAGTEDGLAPLLLGSHIDSVATGGRFDGALGVLAGLELLQTLAEAGHTTRRPLVVAAFTEEEGCRFGTDMLGSAVATGRIPLEEALALRDVEGRSVGEELAAIGFAGTEPVDALRPHAYLELHVEQGPSLGHGGHDIGVVEMVQAISWFRLEAAGRPAHAGTTPLELRRDAGLVAAELNTGLRAMALGGDYGEMRATIGSLRFEPDLVNVIPGRVTGTIDLRNPDDGHMDASEEGLRALAAEVGRRHGVEVRLEQTARTRVVPFDPRLRGLIAAAADARGLSHTRLHSGAGHDAQEWARVCPAAMVFVPGEHEGISHNPRELSTLEQCARGANVLLDVVRELAEEAG